VASRRVLTVARREYLARIRTKAFWITTVALPLLLAAMLVVPALLATQARSTLRVVAVDATGRLGEELAALSDVPVSDVPMEGDDAAMAAFSVTVEEPTGDPEAQRAALDRRILSGAVDAWIWIDEEAIESGRLPYHGESVSNFLTQGRLERELSRLVHDDRLRRAGLDPVAIGELTRGVALVTVRVSSEGSRAEGAEAGIFLSYGLFFLLYIVLLIYGQQVMTGVLEEKTNRIVEVIVATTTPTDLMAGKLAGVCGVALTQLALWMGTVAVLTAPGVVERVALLPPQISIPRVPAQIYVHFFAFFLLGFVLYATFYAAIGAAFNNVQEAQQFASLAAFVLIAPILFFWTVVNDPDSTLSVVMSLVPPFTPLLMLLRITIKTPPAWQIALGYAATALFAWLMIRIAGRIYRVGILMVGKKPTLPELWRWVRYG